MWIATDFECMNVPVESNNDKYMASCLQTKQLHQVIIE